MIFYSISAFINAITSTTVAFVVIFKNPRSQLNRSFSLFALSVALWSYCYFFWQISSEASQALFWSKALMVGAIFIPPTFLHFSVILIKQFNQYRFVIKFWYCIALVFQFLNFTPYLVKGVSHKLFFNFWPDPGIAYFPFIAIFFVLTVYAHVLMYKYFTKLPKFERNQIKYVFIGTGIGFIGGITNYPLWYDIPIPPIGNILVSVYVFLIAYSIIRYRLMDIKIVITKISIFLTVYSLILGIPVFVGFWLFGKGLWLIPVILMGFLATTGPIIYLFIQKRAEDQLMHEQRKYQNTLRHASAGMGKIKDLKQLLSLIVRIINRAVRLEHCSVYLHNSFNKNFVLGAYRRKREGLRTIGYLESNSALVDYLSKHREPLVYEEIKQKAQDFSDPQLTRVELVMKDLDAAVVVPSFIEDRLTAIIMLGEKRSEKLFSESDLAVFTIVANQAALAIENAQFYEDMKKTHEQLFRAEKMATIGTMADGLSHQINNRLHALGFIAGDVMDSIKLKRGVPMPAEIQQLLSDIEFGLQRVQDNVKQGGEIVQGLLKYTRKDESGMGEVDFDQLIKSSIEMAQYKVKTSELKIIKDYPLDLPKIKGNLTQLQEVFFNLIDNANDAMMQRKTEKKEPGYTPELKITAGLDTNHLQIQVVDNGIGVKKEDSEKLFTPFFTTKLSSKKGTGLGLYVLQKIIEDNHNGHVSFFSEYMKETRFVIQLPIVV